MFDRISYISYWGHKLRFSKLENFKNLKKVKFKNLAYVLLSVLLLASVFALAKMVFFQNNASSFEIALIASFNDQNDSDSQLLEQGLIDGLNSTGVANHFSIKHISDDQTRNGLAANKVSLESKNSILTMVGSLHRSSVTDYPDIAEELKIPLLIPRSTPKELQDPEWTFAMQSNMFTNSGLVSSLLLKDIKPKRIGVVINAEDRGSPYFTGITQTLLDSNTQVESTELVKLNNIDDAKSSNSLVQFDLLYLDLNTEFAAAVIKNLKDKNYLGNIVLFDDRLKPNFYQEFAGFPKEKEQAGFYTNNVLIVSGFSGNVSNDQGRVLSQQYIDKNHKNPEPTYVSGYDTGVLLGTYYKNQYQHLQKTLSLEQAREDLKKWLVKLDSERVFMSNFTGEVRFGIGHERNVPPRILVYKDNNRLEPYSSQLANTAPIRVADDDRTIVIDYQDPKYAIVNHLKYTIVPVAFTGIHFRSISDISINKGLYKGDFDLWFRSKVPIDPQDIMFDPAPDEVPDAQIVETEKSGDMLYTRIRFKGTFPFHIQPIDIGLSTINIHFRWFNKKLNASNLFFVIDYDSLNAGNQLDPIYKKINREGTIDPSTGYSAIYSMLSAVEAQIPAYGNLRTIGNTDSYSSSLLKITLSSTASLFSKASIVNFLPNFTLGLICLVILAGIVFVKFSKRILPNSNFPPILASLLGLGLLYFWEMFFFTNSYTQLLPRGWMLMIRNLLDLINYLLLASVICDLVTALCRLRKNFSNIGNTIIKATRFMIYVVALALYYTNVLEKDILPILATSSVILTVVGLAVRDVIFDFVAGIAISFDPTFKPNQWVNFQAKDRRIDGVIEELGWRNVIIRSKDDTKHIIPNSQIYAIIISNNSITDGNRRVDATFFTNTHVDINTVYKVVMDMTLETLKRIPGVPLDKPVRIIFEKIHADGLQLKLQFFLRDRESGEQARSILMQDLHQELAKIDALPAKMVQSQDFRFLEDQELTKYSAGLEQV